MLPSLLLILLQVGGQPWAYPFRITSANKCSEGAEGSVLFQKQRDRHLHWVWKQGNSPSLPAETRPIFRTMADSPGTWRALDRMVIKEEQNNGSASPSASPANLDPFEDGGKRSQSFVLFFSAPGSTCFKEALGLSENFPEIISHGKPQRGHWLVLKLLLSWIWLTMMMRLIPWRVRTWKRNNFFASNCHASQNGDVICCVASSSSLHPRDPSCLLSLTSAGLRRK